MSMYGGFTSSIMGLYSQSRAMRNIGLNIANVHTGGYKKVGTRFSTMLTNSLHEPREIGGVRPREIHMISQQGRLTASGRHLDMAINGRGFFVLNSQIDGNGETFYGRDGAFKQVGGAGVEFTDPNGTKLSVIDGYLADKSGYFVQGWMADDNGEFSGDLGSLRIDMYASVDEARQSTEARAVLNLPADAEVGDVHKFAAELTDTSGQGQTANLLFTKLDMATNLWDVVAVTQGPPTVHQVESVVVSGTVEADDVYQVTVDGRTVSYTATGAEGDMDAVRDALVAAINSDPEIAALVSAEAGPNTGELRLTSATAGKPFGAAAGVAKDGAIRDSSMSVKTITKNESSSLIYSAPTVGGGTQIDTASLSGEIEAGDVYDIFVNGNRVTYTATGSEADMNEIRDALVAAVNDDEILSSLVTAEAADTFGGFTLTATEAGRPFRSEFLTSNAGTDTQRASIQTSTGATEIRFDTNGKILPLGEGADEGRLAELFYDFTWPNGETTAVTIDISEVNQLASTSLQVGNYQHNGNALGRLTSFSFDKSGTVHAKYTNGTVRPVYKLPLAVFINEDQLSLRDGNVYQENTETGDVRLYDAGKTQFGTFSPGYLEISNVELAEEFTNMIITQNAYNSSATVFKSVNEMTQTATELIA